MREATRLTRSGRLTEATEAIQRALSGAAGANAVHGRSTSHTTQHTSASVDALVLDGSVFEVDERSPAAAAATLAEPPARTAPADTPHAWPRPAQDDIQPAGHAGQGEFTNGTHTHASLTRRYKLYSPPGHADKALPMVVMLHGCNQDPDDFAAGTAMNERAREQGFFVLYPAQSQHANASRCWNWFKHNHQRRGGGEPALLAGMTQAVMKQHGIDARRVYIAGLSAGGAMAAIMGEAYPDIFAAVGVHSGLPRGAANSVSEALAVMKSGVPGPGLHAKATSAGTAPTAPVAPHVPTIVFHGDQDRTVHPRNGEQVIAAALASAAFRAEPANAIPASSPRVEQGESAQGRRYTRSIHPGDEGGALAEHWLVHGAGHAWSGGQSGGSYTDAKGPDATREMLRFFFEHPHGLEH